MIAFTRQSLFQRQIMDPTPQNMEGSLWDRTLRSVRSIWVDLAASLESPAIHPDVDAKSADLLLKQMQACIDAEGGEVSARARAAQLGESYLGLSEAGKENFLNLLADHFGPSPDAVEQATTNYLSLPLEEREQGLPALSKSLIAPRTALLRQFNAIPQGVKFLVDLRADLLPHINKTANLKALDAELQALLADWFDIGFLELQTITWNSPAALLEKLMAYEAVHEIRSWTDLRNRLDSDRRLFAFFHPRMPMEPLIFVEVALVNGIASSVQALLDEDAPINEPAKSDTAIFYSISNTQEGLRGISFGNFLIKRVVEELRAEFPNLKTFSTLSPIPGFRRWLDRQIQDGSPGILAPEDRKHFKKQTGESINKGDLARILKDGDWINEPAQVEGLKQPLMRLCARYLVQEKSRNAPADPVARFHLSNGAQVERLCWMGNTSGKGLRESATIMVNYLYSLSDIERNHERFARDGFVTTSSTVRSMLKG